VKQAMDPTRVTAAVPTPSHPLHVSRRCDNRGIACPQVDNQAIKSARNKAYPANEIHSRRKPVFVSNYDCTGLGLRDRRNMAPKQVSPAPSR
jgi:hypothetical protein